MTYDVIVLGSGPGGYSAAVRAGQYGLKTALIEKDAKLGGCCLHVGCIPTKAFLHTADVWERFQHSVEEGIHCENPRLDFPLVLGRKNLIVSKHAKGVEFLMKKNKVDVIRGYGRLAGPGKIEVTSESGKQIVEAKNIVLATGSEARMLPGLQPDAKRILTNIEILNLSHVPQSIAILGAGAVGVEFASCFHRFGSKVSVFEMLPRIVPVEDEEVSKELARVFKKQGIRVETSARCENIERTANGVRSRKGPRAPERRVVAGRDRQGGERLARRYIATTDSQHCTRPSRAVRNRRARERWRHDDQQRERRGALA